MPVLSRCMISIRWIIMLKSAAAKITPWKAPRKRRGSAPEMYKKPMLLSPLKKRLEVMILLLPALSLRSPRKA